jgi:hypothetical protein
MRARVRHRHSKLNEFGDTIDFGEDWSDQVIGDVNELQGGTDGRTTASPAGPGSNPSQDAA